MTIRPQDRDGVLDRLQRSPLTGLARRTLARRRRHFAVWNGSENDRGDTFRSTLELTPVGRPEAHSRWTPDGATISISTGMTSLAERLFVAVTRLIRIDERGEIARRPYADHAAAELSRDDLMLAAFLIDQAVGFIADHEFVHAINGHTILVSEGALRSAAFAEGDLYRALELEADRSAMFCLIDDVCAGRAATNDVTDRLEPHVLVALTGLAVGVLCAVWLAAEDEDGAPTFHPPARTRVFMLLGPSLSRALAGAGWQSPSIRAMQRVLGRALVEVGACSRRLRPLVDIFRPEEDVHARENQRLENVYRSALAPALVPLHFAPANGPGRAAHLSKPT